MNIVLIGYRCCGKTSVGKRIAGKLGRQFIDADEYIIEKAGAAIDEIVARHGWNYFREIERDVIKDISLRDNLVIATGGGAVLYEENITHLKSNGFVVWLYAGIDIIKKRLNEDETSAENRPSLTGDDPSDEIKAVLEERELLYKGASDIAVDTSKMSVNEVAEVIVKEIKSRSQRSEI